MASLIYIYIYTFQLNENSSKNYLIRDIKLNALHGFCQFIIKKRREVVLKIIYVFTYFK